MARQREVPAGAARQGEAAPGAVARQGEAAPGAVARQGEAAAGAVGRGEVPSGAAGREAAGAAGRAWEEEEPREKRGGDRRAAVHAGVRTGQRVGLAVPGPAGIRRARSSGPRVPGESPSRAWSTDLTGIARTSFRLLLGSCKLGRVRREAFATSPLCRGRVHGRIRRHCCHALLRHVPASRWRSAAPTGMFSGVGVGCQQTCLNGWCGGRPARTHTVVGGSPAAKLACREVVDP